MTNQSSDRKELIEPQRRAPGIAQEIPGKCSVQLVPNGPVREYAVAYAEEFDNGVNTIYFYSKSSVNVHNRDEWVFRVDIARDLAPGEYELPLFGGPVSGYGVLFVEGGDRQYSGGYGAAGTLNLIENDFGSRKLKGVVTNLRAEWPFPEEGDSPAFAHRVEFRTGL